MLIIQSQKLTHWKYDNYMSRLYIRTIFQGGNLFLSENSQLWIDFHYRFHPEIPVYIPYKVVVNTVLEVFFWIKIIDPVFTIWKQKKFWYSRKYEQWMQSSIPTTISILSSKMLRYNKIDMFESWPVSD